MKWIYRTSILAWTLIFISLISVFIAVKAYRMKGGNQSALIDELEGEITTLKKINEQLSEGRTTSPGSPVSTTPQTEDPNARDTKPELELGQPMDPIEGLWTGLAPHISAPPTGTVPTVQLSDVKLEWQGKFAIITGIVAYRETGKGSQQGHLVVLARGKDRIFAHPDSVLNAPSSSYLFDSDRGEYFSVARFRILKTKLGPFEQPSQLNQIQVYLFDLNRKLILTQSYQYGKK